MSEQPKEIKLNDVISEMRHTVIDVTLPADQSRKILLEGINLLVAEVNKLADEITKSGTEAEDTIDE